MSDNQETQNEKKTLSVVLAESVVERLEKITAETRPRTTKSSVMAMLIEDGLDRLEAEQIAGETTALKEVHA